jgi:rRNA maturation endonuclease Nob1
MVEKFVFDANFFICMLSINARKILKNLEKAASELDYEYYISDIVFDEIKAPKNFQTNFKKVIHVQEIKEKEVDSIKQKLSKRNIRFPAQDPDLTLIVLAENLTKEKTARKVHLITDDYKLAKNAAILHPQDINVLSLSSFLLKIHRGVYESSMRNYFKNIWKRSLNYTLGYMLDSERLKIYRAEKKITWLIERAVSVTEDSIVTQDACLEDGQMEFGIGCSKYEEELEIADKYIEGRKITQSEEERVSNIINFLENLKISREYVKKSRNAIVHNESKDAVKFLKKGNGFLVSLLQLASGKIQSVKDYEIVEQLICSEISKMEFLRAFLLVSLGRVNSAIDSLERAALFSTIIHNYQTCLTLNYVKALILLFHGLYNNSIMAYNFTEELASVYQNERLKLKCAIGKAIALYIQGGEKDKNAAMDIMDEISALDLKDNITDAIVVFSELGDYFLALGHSQLATNLYNESMEMAIDQGLDWKVDILIQKLKQAYIATVINGYASEDIVDNVDVLLNKAYRVKNVDEYNNQIKKIASFNRLFYSPFKYLHGKKKTLKYTELPKELKDTYLEVVHFIKEEENQFLFIISHYELALLGVRIKTDQNITGIAENYSLKLSSHDKFKIYEPSEELKNTYLIRAIIEVQGDDTEINYSLPTFFKQLNL